jgi:OFA family oxalate/formate antiporter-like MFS transporter
MKMLAAACWPLKEWFMKPADVADPAVNPRTKYFVLLGAIIVQLILGTVYGYSIFWEPLQTEIFPSAVTVVQHDELVASGGDIVGLVVVADDAALAARVSTEQGYLKYAFSICILSFAVVMVIAGRLQDIKGPRFTATIGGVLMGTGFILAGLMNSPIVFTVAHAAFTGAAAIVLLMIFHALFGRLDPEEVPIIKYIPLGIVASVVSASVLLGQGYIGKTGELEKLFLLWGTIGFTAGAGIGFAYVCPIAALIKWFRTQGIGERACGGGLWARGILL